jgi:lactoylglutathione lyase
MNFKLAHTNFNVLDLEKSLTFYREALGLVPVREKAAEDGSFKLVYLGDGETSHQLELTWLRDREAPYDLGEGEFHLAFLVDDYAAAHAKHKAMGCICFENPAMGIYFISDPDGYWLEVIPARRS